MAVALRQTDDRQGYTLSDDATFWQLEPQLNNVVVFDNNPRLLNTYAVVHPPDHSIAARFAEWLAQGFPAESGSSTTAFRNVSRSPCGHSGVPPTRPVRNRAAPSSNDIASLIRRVPPVQSDI